MKISIIDCLKTIVLFDSAKIRLFFLIEELDASLNEELGVRSEALGVNKSSFLTPKS